MRLILGEEDVIVVGVGDLRERLVQRMREAAMPEIPQDFIDALEDFDNQRFVSMETALNETPPGA